MIAGRRPLSIRLFAFAWLTQLALALAHGLAGLPAYAAMFTAIMPDIVWDDAAVRVALLVRAAVGLLPLWLIHARATRFARWAATVLVLGRLYLVPEAVAAAMAGNAAAMAWLLGLTIALLAVWLLFRADSRWWFASGGVAQARSAPDGEKIF